MMKFLEGKKTYLVMAVVVVLGGIDAWNQHCLTNACMIINIPAWVFSLLGVLGIYTRKVAK